MALIAAPSDCARWLGEEPDPHDLMRSFPTEPSGHHPIVGRLDQLVATAVKLDSRTPAHM